jgi:hypothetical protein
MAHSQSIPDAEANSRSQSYDRELQRHGQPTRFENKNI